ARDGQQEDIKVCRLPGRSSFLLVAGGHRLTAARINGWATIRAQLVSADPAERALIEISDNLIRTDLSALDRAFFVGEFYRVTAERLGRDVSQKPQSIAAQARWK